MTPQAYGRWLEAAIIDHYGWGEQPGSGNRWNHPSDAIGPHEYQIEIKAHQWTPGHGSSTFSLPLLRYWRKVEQEAQQHGRIPLLVVALRVTWAVAFTTPAIACDWDLPPLKDRVVESGKTVREDPVTWLTGMRYHTPHGVWIRLPLDDVPGLVVAGS